MKQREIDTGTGEQLHTADSVAALEGGKVSTLDAYLSRDQMPAPLGAVGRTQPWPCTVVESWLTLRGHSQVTAELRDQDPSRTASVAPMDPPGPQATNHDRWQAGLDHRSNAADQLPEGEGVNVGRRARVRAP